MLFKTVYGPELKCIYDFLKLSGPTEKSALYRAFVPLVGGEMGARANFDDAITFLTTAGMITKGESGRYEAVGSALSFKMLLLSNLREMQLGAKPAQHPLDPWYLELINQLFVRKNRTLAFGLHQLANSFDVPEVLSAEKINAWRRVLEFIGLGSRLAAGFLCCYGAELVWEIICLWEESEGPAQVLLEDHISKFLPWESEAGDVSMPLKIPLLILAREGYILLEERQDLPNSAYLGDRKVKWVRKVGEKNCLHASRKAV